MGSGGKGRSRSTRSTTKRQTKKAAAARENGRKGGRPPKTGMKDGEVELVQLASQACERLGEQHPAVQRVMKVLIAIQEGRPGYCGRYVHAKLGAAKEELKFHLALPGRKPVAPAAQPIEPKNLIIVNAILKMTPAAIAQYAETGELPKGTAVVAHV